MIDGEKIFTSESVTEGHPDKMCDAISDAILDALMEQDPMSRVACETATTTGLVLVMGEITTKAYVDIQKIVRETVREIGYDRAKYGFDCDTCGVITAIDEQSSDIAMGVDKALEGKGKPYVRGRVGRHWCRATRYGCSAMQATRQRSICISYFHGSQAG